jgi:hypothetical protein
MAKRRRSIADRLKTWREFLEDVTECYPEGLSVLFEEKRSAAVLEAARYFNLDLTNQLDADRLLHILADVVFPGTGRQQGDKHWGIERLTALGAHFLEVRGRHLILSDSKAAEEIKERYPKLYQSAAAIRPHLYDGAFLYFTINKIGRKIKEWETTPPTRKERLFTKREIDRFLDLIIDDFEKLPREKRREIFKKLSRIVAVRRSVIDALRRKGSKRADRPKLEIVK